MEASDFNIVAPKGPRSSPSGRLAARGRRWGTRWCDSTQRPRRRTGGRVEMEGGSKGGDEKRQNESEIQVKLGAWRGEAASYRDRAGDNRGLSKRRGKEGRRDRDRVLKEWRGAGAQMLLCRWLCCLATAVVGRPRAMQGAPHEKLNWCCTAVPRRLDDQLAKQVESWSWPRRNAKSTGCTRR